MDPLSLQAFAAGAAAQVHPDVDLSFSTAMVFHVIMQKKGRQLVDYIEEQGGLVELRSKLENGNLYQKILFHTIREMEECSLDSSKTETNKKFIDLFKNLRTNLAKLSYDFVTQSLACSPLLFQKVGRKFPTIAYFFLRKNENAGPCGFATLPVAHPELMPFLEANKKENVNIHQVYVPKHSRGVSECDVDDSDTLPWENVDIETFFSEKLLDMVYEQKKMAHHRTIAYGFDLLLCNKPISIKEKKDQESFRVLESQMLYSLNKKQKLEKLETKSQQDESEKNNETAELLTFQRNRIKFRDHSAFKSDFTYVWSMLGVSFASVGIEPKYAMACIQKAEKLATCFSQEIDVLLCKQQVFAKFGWLTNETHVFQHLYKIVPRNSRFFLKMLKCHFWACIYAVENCIFHNLIIENVFSDEDFFLPFDPTVIQFSDQKIENQNEAKEILFSLKKLLLEILWKVQIDFEFPRDIEEWIEIVHLYETILECKFFSGRRSRYVYDVEAMAFKLKNSSLHYASFLSLYSIKGFSFHRYVDRLKLNLDYLKNVSATNNSIEQGHVIFSHVVLMKCLKFQEETFAAFSDVQCRKTNKIFENYNHPRRFMTNAFFETLSEYIPKKPPPIYVNLDDVVAADDMTLESFLSNKKIVHFINSGIHH